MNYTYELKSDLSAKDVLYLLQETEVGIDCETTGLKFYRDKLSLVQIFLPSKNKVFLIRNTNWKKAKYLISFLKNKKVIKLFHHARFDCSMLAISTGVIPQNPYCTKIASKIARTYSPSHSLKTLIHEFFNVAVDKSMQISFWGKQKLTDKQLEYASIDVIWLVKIKQKLEEILINKGNLKYISYFKLNVMCQKTLPTLIQLHLGGWDLDSKEAVSYDYPFGY